MPHDKNDIKSAIYSILSALAEGEEYRCDGIPESHAYLALGSDMELWNAVRAVISPDWVSISGNLLTLTTDGRELGTAISQALAKKERFDGYPGLGSD